MNWNSADRWAPEARAKVRALRAEGLTLQQIADAMGLKRASVIGEVNRQRLADGFQLTKRAPKPEPAPDEPYRGDRNIASGWALPAGHYVTAGAIGLQPWAGNAL